MKGRHSAMSFERTRQNRRAARTIVPLALLALSCGDGSTAAAPAGPIEVVTETRELIDDSRPTSANGDFAGLPHRIVETHLWYAESPPADNTACRDGACALVLVAHGFGGFPTIGFEVLGHELASAGYVVASVRFPLTNGEAPGGFGFGIGDVVNQPGDLSFVIDRLIAASSGGSGDALAGRIDSERIGTLGHSLGGVTALAQSRFDCCSDERVGAVALVAANLPAGNALFGSTPSPGGPPTLLLSGTEDTLAPPEIAPMFYDVLSAPRTMVILEGAGHRDVILSLGGVVTPALETSLELLVSFFDQYIGKGERLVATLQRLEEKGHVVRHENGPS